MTTRTNANEKFLIHVSWAYKPGFKKSCTVVERDALNIYNIPLAADKQRTPGHSQV